MSTEINNLGLPALIEIHHEPTITPIPPVIEPEEAIISTPQTIERCKPDAIGVKIGFKRSFRVSRGVDPVVVKKLFIAGFGEITVYRQMTDHRHIGFDVLNEDGVHLHNDLPLPAKPTNAELRSIVMTFQNRAELGAEMIEPTELPKPKTVKCATKGCATKFATLAGTPTEKQKYCKECALWIRRIELPKYRSVRLHGQHYTNGAVVKHGVRGFGGEVFVLTFKDGTVVDTSDLWPNGPIPSRFKKLLPDNMKQIWSSDRRMKL